MGELFVNGPNDISENCKKPYEIINNRCLLFPKKYSEIPNKANFINAAEICQSFDDGSLFVKATEENPLTSDQKVLLKTYFGLEKYWIIEEENLKTLDNCKAGNRNGKLLSLLNGKQDQANYEGTRNIALLTNFGFEI